MIPLSLEVKNLGPFKDLTVPMGDHTFCLLQGVNLDEEGMDSNGAGKSFFLDLFYWVLTGEIARIEGKITDEIIRWGCDKGEGKIRILDEGAICCIERARGKNGKKSLKFYVEGDSVSEKRLTGKTDTETQKNIYGWFGADAASIAMMVYYGQGQAAILVNRGPQDRVKALGALFPQITEFEIARNRAIENRRITKRGLEGVRAQLEALGDVGGKNKEDILKDIQSVKKRIVQLDTVEVSLTEKLKKKEEVPSRIDLEEKLEGIKETIGSVRRDQVKYDKAKKSISILEKSIEKFEVVVERVTAELEELESQRNGLRVKGFLPLDLIDRRADLNLLIKQAEGVVVLGEKCPTCTEEVRPKTKERMKFNLTKYKKEREVILSIENEIKRQRAAELEAISDVINEVVKERDNALSNVHSLKTELRVANEVVDEFESFKMDELGDTYLEKLCEQQDELEEKIASGKERDEEGIHRIQEKIKSVREKKLDFASDKGVYEAELNMLEQVEEKSTRLKQKKRLLEKKYRVFDFLDGAFAELRLVIIDAAVPQFQERVNYYLTVLGINKRVRFETQVEYKSQEGVRDKFEIFVIPGPGYDEVRWELYSGGEKRRISLALFTAMNDLATKRALKPIEFAFFDEITENLDITGQKRILELLKDQLSRGKRIWTVSHLDKVKDAFDERLTFIKEGGVSRLEGEE